MLYVSRVPAPAVSIFGNILNLFCGGKEILIHVTILAEELRYIVSTPANWHFSSSHLHLRILTLPGWGMYLTPVNFEQIKLKMAWTKKKIQAYLTKYISITCLVKGTVAQD